MQKPTRPIPFPEFVGQQASSSHAFEVSVLGDSTVSVNEYSSILQNFEARDKFPILNLDSEIILHYGTKLFLEVYFDKNLTPLTARIRYDDRWYKTSTTKTTTTGDKSSIPTYPNEIEIISTADISAKLDEINEDITSADTEASQTIENINLRVSQNTLTREVADQRIATVNSNKDQYLIAMKALQNSITKFFTGNNLSARKQLKLYKLIAYTTLDANPTLDSEIIKPPVDFNEDVFHLVQCTNTNLMFVDSCVKGIPVKVLIPWTSPVFEYEIDEDGTLEDEKNSGVKG